MKKIITIISILAMVTCLYIPSVSADAYSDQNQDQPLDYHNQSDH